MLYAFLIYRGGNVVGMCLHAVIGVAHCHSDTAVFQHLNVVATVPESDTFFFFDTEMAQYAFNAGGFAVGAILGGTVGFFKWMFNGFQDDNMARSEPLPEDILPPTRDNEYGGRL